MPYIEPHFATSALIIIDVQNDFTIDGAPAQIEGTLRVLPSVAKLLAAYRDTGRPIVHIVRLYRPDGSNVDACRRQMIEDGKRIVAPGSPGSQIPVELRLEGMPELDHEHLLENKIQIIGATEVAIYKPRWGAFYSTPLHDHLQDLSVDTLVFCGCNFPNCPRTSIYEASERDYRLVLATDAISRTYDQGLREMAAIGVYLMNVYDICSHISANAERD